MWRWSHTTLSRLLSRIVISTYVEMILEVVAVPIEGLSDLHVCGDDPVSPSLSSWFSRWSPRMWRWSWRWRWWRQVWNVISTYVEMILDLTKLRNSTWGDLHVCGDDPYCRLSVILTKKLSPRMWRWSHHLKMALSMISVISTYVEMILRQHSLSWQILRDLHVCGDDPRWNSYY